MTKKHGTYDQHNTTHTGTSSGGYGGSTSSTPSLKHTLAHMTPAPCPGFAAAEMRQQQQQRGMVQLSHCIRCLENEVHQTLAVVDVDTGELLNYRQLTQSTKHKKTWSLSSANKFKCLANGIDNRITNPTNSIEFIYQHEIPKECKRDIMYGQFVCIVRPKKAETNQT